MAEQSYLAAIEEYFANKRGHALILSPKDWPLVTAWQEQRIPLDVIFEGIDRAFARLDEHPNPRRRKSLRSLSACRYDVETLWKAHQEQEQAAAQPAEDEAEVSLLAEKQQLLTKLRSVVAQLRKIAERPKYRCIADHVLLTSDTLELLVPEVEQCADSVSLAQCRQQIRQCEHELVSNLKAALPDEERQALEARVEAQLAPYKRNMKPAVYQETLQIALLKALREAYPFPSFA